MSETTTITTTAMRVGFRRGELVVTWGTQGRCEAVVVRHDFDVLTTRPVRWYDRIRWWAQGARVRIRAAIVRIFARATP